MRVLGIMSDTSLDGVDYALCRVNEKTCELLEYWDAKFDPELQGRLMAAATDRASSYEVAQLHHDLGRFYARHATPHGRVELVGLHGQTIFHNPLRKNPATFQIGEPAYLAEKLDVPIVSNFRAADLAAGGQGAPLATIFHVPIFGKEGRHVCVNNLGGISNITSIRLSERGKPSIQAFDTGPGNVLIDLAMRELTAGKHQMDGNGLWAAKGASNEEFLSTWLRHPFFRERPPKSTGRELFGEPFFSQAMTAMRKRRMSRYDILATFTSFTARSIALNCRLHLKNVPQEVILTGGGAANPVLVRDIASGL